jgi:hypothetical protein
MVVCYNFLLYLNHNDRLSIDRDLYLILHYTPAQIGSLVESLLNQFVHQLDTQSKESPQLGNPPMTMHTCSTKAGAALLPLFLVYLSLAPPRT